MASSSLPPGAAPPTVLTPPSPTLPASTRPTPVHQGASQVTTLTYQSERDNDSPPGTPSQRLLDVPQQDSSRPQSPHVQYATYPDEKRQGFLQAAVMETGTQNVSAEANLETRVRVKPYVPHPLRPWFWIPFVCILVLGAIGLEVALHFSNKNNGWNTASAFSTDQRVLHYVYALFYASRTACMLRETGCTGTHLSIFGIYYDNPVSIQTALVSSSCAKLHLYRSSSISLAPLDVSLGTNPSLSFLFPGPTHTTHLTLPAFL
ncbi:hypothetical protein K435DRAFT_797269 [Dendrothele bispora CBS 962.96]|uniref:Uncharacterized protein n=1 Tax=Dendrothele bispora (strain CBS 962.96) TaxID=1314807 RepID=A0A4S8M464_DENBC|nr:hypothetical protein K435DRAFT_797269 [Dendrothele bispora CBS 962.96]